MKHLGIILTFLVVFLLPQTAFPEGKAVFMVHFGTSHEDTREKTIDAINCKVKNAFPDYVFREAYSSRIIGKILKKRGMVKSTPLEGLLKLASEGVDTVYVQPTFILDGVEYKMLVDEVDRMKPFFKHIEVGTPLLYSQEDSGRVAEILASAYSSNKSGNHFIFVGHGSPGPYNAIYSQLDYQFKAEGKKNMHVATIEGFPTLETAERIVKESKGKNITLIPLLFVAGDHASNDIAVEYKAALEEKGYNVEAILKGLGEMPEIQDMYISNLKKMIK